MDEGEIKCWRQLDKRPLEQLDRVCVREERYARKSIGAHSSKVLVRTGVPANEVCWSETIDDRLG